MAPLLKGTSGAEPKTPLVKQVQPEEATLGPIDYL